MTRYLLTILIFLYVPLPCYGQSDSDRSVEVRIRQTAREQLHQQFAVPAARLEIRIDQLEASVPSGRSIRVQFSNDWEIPRGRARAQIYTRQKNSGWKESGWALLNIAHYDSVMVARRALRPDDEVTPDDIHTAWVDVTRFRDQPLTPDRYRALRAEGRSYTRQYLREGEIIRQTSIRRAYAAEAGDALMMIYERNGIAAHLRCRARQSGFAGEIVRVACPSTGSFYRARLTDDGTAAWMETL